MIWYLLYPFRGTTEAPVLAPSHPLRSAFTRYGRYAASHVVTTLLISVAVAAILIYPFPFLYTNDFTNGASNLPHHVWTDAQPLAEKNLPEPDVIMRSIWVHGSYFQALDKEVLLGALELQNELLGPTVDFDPRMPPGSMEAPDPRSANLTPGQRDSFHIVNGLRNESWFFHSPLQYWSCCAEVIDRDDNIIATVNERKTQATSVNITLRHSIVFAGKRFEDRRLVAADSLVITLIHLRDSPVGRLWQERARALVDKVAEKWDVILPLDHRSGQLYEFQFRPMSAQDACFLAIAYCLVFVYFVVSLSKLRAVKSKFGLMVTVVAQIVLSIMSSFTLCAIFKIDLSRIPRSGYPVVIFSMSLENIFRLINAVIMTPSENKTSYRIGHAFGETGHIAVASVAQNLLILYGLSRVVSPGVSAFCTFAAIALIFDFFYLSTFFLSVLSVDVRRTELSDALAKASIRSRTTPAMAPSRQAWMDAMLQGKIAMSTRIAGTIVMVGFVLIAQWHFFENETVMKTLGRITQMSPKYQHLNSSHPSLLVDIHQARSPTSWLRLQDHETAREVIQVVKPHAHSYVARVFDPLVFVLKGSDRMLSAHERRLLPAVYDFVRHQSAPFIVTVIVIAAAVRLLMNYLLWDQLADANGIGDPEDERLISVKTLSRGHALDVALLSASSNGQLVSIGLDRIIRVWDVKSGGGSYVLGENDDWDVPFPILAMCIEDESRWLALLTSDSVLLWNLASRQWGPTVPVDSDRHKPEAFFFTHDDYAKIPPLVIVRREGILTQLRADKKESSSYMIADNDVLVSADALSEKSFPVQIMASTREGQVRVISQDGDNWISSNLNIHPSRDREFISIIALPALGFFLLVRSQSVVLVDAQTRRAIHTFDVDPIQPKSMKCFHSRPRKMRCGSLALWSFTLTYLNTYTRDLVVQTYSPEDEGESLCFCDPASPTRKTCCPWQRAKETRRVIENPGMWEALPSGIVVGVRQKAGKKSLDNGHRHPQHPLPPTDGLRHRRRHHLHPKSSYSYHHSSHPPATATATSMQDDNWEVWMFSHFGKQETWEKAPLCPKDEAEDDAHLFVTHLGPVIKMGRSSVAVGLSNVVKVIVVGHERFESEDDKQQMGELGVPMSISGRRRKGLSSASSTTTIPNRGRPSILPPGYGYGSGGVEGECGHCNASPSLGGGERRK
ncbi:sterol-sensing domain of SREBP cleavage-activation-domain-containing protein [Xylariomycetidae sp. FL2044]|nr:sterol-sensing domain of SREBP cleavage-activation-domain-containing protein [Xylariomycetidae sp. FL2044]